MNQESYAVSYRAAVDAATAELDGLFEEAKQMRNRMEQIDSVLTALKPLLTPGEQISSETSRTNQPTDSTLGLVFA